MSRGPVVPMQPPSTLTPMMKKRLGIERLARAHHLFPPAGLAGDGMLAGQELVAGQRMAGEDGVGTRGVQLAIGLIGDGERAEIDAAIQRHLALLAEYRPESRQRGV